MEAIAGKGFRFIVIDLFGFFVFGAHGFQHQVDALKYFAKLTHSENCTILVIHHPRKVKEENLLGIDDLKGDSSMMQDSNEIMFIDRKLSNDPFGEKLKPDATIRVAKKKHSSHKNHADVVFQVGTAKVIERPNNYSQRVSDIKLAESSPEESNESMVESTLGLGI